MGNTKVKKYQVVEAILYRLKTGCQWRELPMKQFFRTSYEWNSVYYHFQKWSKDGSWDQLWQTVLTKHKHLLDLSSIQLDGTHTPAKRGGDEVGYQGRKKCSTSNLLIISDNQGIPLICSEPVSGNHNDSFNLVNTTDKMFSFIRRSNIRTDGLFLNADASIDVLEFRQYCEQNEIIDNIDINKRNGSGSENIFDEILYKCRFVIERTNA
jgi:transposase